MFYVYRQDVYSSKKVLLFSCFTKEEAQYACLILTKQHHFQNLTALTKLLKPVYLKNNFTDELKSILDSMKLIDIDFWFSVFSFGSPKFLPSVHYEYQYLENFPFDKISKE